MVELQKFHLIGTITDRMSGKHQELTIYSGGRNAKTKCIEDCFDSLNSKIGINSQWNERFSLYSIIPLRRDHSCH